MDEIFSSWPDLTNQTISHLYLEYFMDGNSFVQDGTCFAGYTDSKYAFTTIHVHGALYKEGDSLTWEEKVLNMEKNSKITKICMGP
jgi:hypothetical protein